MAADRTEIENLIRAADAAGDAEAVKVLFGELDKMPKQATQQVTPQEMPAQPKTTIEQPSIGQRFLAAMDNKWNPLRYGAFGVPFQETAANLASGALSAPVAGLAGIGSGMDANVTESVGEALTYHPKTEGGKTLTNAVTWPFQKLAQGADWVGDKLNNPGVVIPTPYGNIRGGAGPAAVANTAIQSLPALLMKGPKAKPAAAKPAAVVEPSPRQALFDEMNAKGLKVDPTSLGTAKAGSMAEGLAGQAKLERSLSLKNSKRVNELVAEDLGLKGKKEITKADLNRLRVESNRPYSAIAKTGERKTSPDYKAEIEAIGDKTGGSSFASVASKEVAALKEGYSKIAKFTAEDAVNQVRQLRKDGNANKGGKYDPAKSALGDAQLKIAEAIDNELGRHVESLGKPKLLANYKAARIQLAKINSVQNALRGSNISARALAKAKDRGAPLSGNMDLIARAFAEFDRSFQDVAKIRDGSPFGSLDLGAGVVGAASSPPLAAAVIARPVARAILSSDRYQRSLTSGGQKTPQAKAVDNQLARPAVANSLVDREKKR